MIKDFVRSFFVNSLVLWVLTQYVAGFKINDGVIPLFIISLAFTCLHMLMKPLLETVFSSINFLTLGAVGVGVDSAILIIITKYFTQISISPWHFQGATIQGYYLPPSDLNTLATIILVALILNVVRTIVEMLT